MIAISYTFVLLINISNYLFKSILHINTNIDTIMKQHKESLKDLQNELRDYRGSIREIANRCEVSYHWVWQVIRGHANNQRVLETAFEVLKDRKKAAIDSVEKFSRQVEEVLK